MTNVMRIDELESDSLIISHINPLDTFNGIISYKGINDDLLINKENEISKFAFKFELDRTLGVYTNITETSIISKNSIVVNSILLFIPALNIPYPFVLQGFDQEVNENDKFEIRMDSISIPHRLLMDTLKSIGLYKKVYEM